MKWEEKERPHRQRLGESEKERESNILQYHRSYHYERWAERGKMRPLPVVSFSGSLIAAQPFSGIRCGSVMWAWLSREFPSAINNVKFSFFFLLWIHLRRLHTPKRRRMILRVENAKPLRACCHCFNWWMYRMSLVVRIFLSLAIYLIQLKLMFAFKMNKNLKKKLKWKRKR